MSNIGSQVRHYRDERDMTQQQLADESGIERYNIGKIETGKRDVSGTELAFLADALGVAPSALLREEGTVVMFRHRQPRSVAANRAIDWFEEYVANAARLRGLERDFARPR